MSTELGPEDEVTLRLTISGLYPAIRKNYTEPGFPLPTDQQCADLDADGFSLGATSLEDLVSWLDSTSDVQVRIEVER